MTGQLQEHPLAELLREISAAGLSGALRSEHERFKTVVYLADGEVIYAASNLRQHRLLECLRRWRALSEEELSTLPADVSDPDLGAALIAAKTLNPESLAVLQARQLTEVLRPALLWTQGTWEFDARVRLSQNVRVSVEMRSLLLEAARHLPPEFVADRFREPQEKLSPEKNAAANLELLPTEAFVLSRIDAPLTLAEVIAVSTLPETETMQAVYTLALGGLIERERWPSVFSPEMLERAHSVKAASKGGPRPLTSEPQAKEASAAAAPPPAAVEQEAEEVLALDSLFSRLTVAADYYQVLGVRRSASVGEIKSAYHRLAKRFHPDRFHRDEDATLHARVGEAFARIAQSYETLKEKQSRAAYDLKLSQQSTATTQAESAASKTSGGRGTTAGEGSVDTATLLRKAEENFQRGMLALNRGKPMVAISSFGEAARLAPRNARYRAFHGRALAENEGTRRQAEAELKAAIALESNNAEYHVMLGEFYFKIGLPRRAQSELERALALDAQNASARQLLDNLQATLKGQI
ncbi:MAG TPA: DnaJ domain-containing protein [Pyrinomonadaceae bacterium]|jgi:curved DNA-binding protein CbpA